MDYSSKQCISTLAALVFGLVAAEVAAAGDPVSTGDWSEPVDGLRARLHVAFEKTKDSPREAVVYLELQNLTNVASPMAIFYGTDTHCSTSWSLTDSNHVAVPKIPIAIRRPVLPAYWIILPYDSSLRFRATHGNIAGGKKDTTFMILPPSEYWSLSDSSHADYYLSCTFGAETPAGETEHHFAWQGSLKIPPVKISTQGRE